MTRFKKLALSALVLAIAIAAFRLSFDAQVKLAIGSGIDGYLAPLYPLIIDAAILAGVLIRVWYPEASRDLARYLWGAVALWTITSVLGNAFHVLILPDGSVTLPAYVAVGVNTMPALTLFLIIHITTKIAFPPVTTTPAAAEPLQSTTSTPPRSRKPGAATRPPRADADGLPTPAEMLARSEAGETVQQIADSIDGRGKTWVADRVKEERERVAHEAEPGLRRVS